MVMTAVEPPLSVSVKLPAYTVPRASRIVSPGCAVTSALCSSGPDATEIVDACDVDATANAAQTLSAVQRIFMFSCPETDWESARHSRRAAKSVSWRDYRTS